MDLTRRLIAAAVLLAGISGLAIAMIGNTHLFWDWLGTPPTSLASLHKLPASAGNVLLAIGVQGPHRPEAWLGQLPILDFFVLAMFLTGLFFYFMHWRATRTRLLASYLVLGITLASFNETQYSLLVPLLYLIALAGMAYMLHFWLKMFPFNPIARSFGMMLLTIVVLVSSGYNLAQYFIAWPHNPEAMHVYRLTK